MQRFLKKLKVEYDLTKLLNSRQYTQITPHPTIDRFAHLCLAMARQSHQPNCPSTGEQIMKTLYVNGILFNYKDNAIIKIPGKWIDLGNIMILSKAPKLREAKSTFSRLFLSYPITCVRCECGYSIKFRKETKRGYC